MKDDYYKRIRKNLMVFVTGKDNIILEVGCAEGYTGYELKKSGLASKIIGIEINPDAAQKAEKHLDHVVCGDIEALSLEESFFAHESFDYIICGDVLEHLRDPWIQLARLKSLLKHDGKIIISLPNVRYWSVLLPLVFKGEWNYTNAGILDRTHLRFFTKKAALELCQQAKFKKIICKPAFGRRLNRMLNILSLTILQDFVSPQWVIICQK